MLVKVFVKSVELLSQIWTLVNVKSRHLDKRICQMFTGLLVKSRQLDFSHPNSYICLEYFLTICECYISEIWKDILVKSRFLLYLTIYID